MRENISIVVGNLDVAGMALSASLLSGVIVSQLLHKSKIFDEFEHLTPDDRDELIEMLGGAAGGMNMLVAVMFFVPNIIHEPLLCTQIISTGAMSGHCGAYLYNAYEQGQVEHREADHVLEEPEEPEVADDIIFENLAIAVRNGTDWVNNIVRRIEGPGI